MCALVTEQRAARHYLPGSCDFLDYFESVASATQRFVQGLSKAGTPECVEADASTAVWNLAGLWAELHRYIKPVVDAHTLCLPVPLLELIRRQVKALDCFAGAEVAFEASVQFSYAQRVQEGLEELGADFRTALARHGAPTFPSQLALIALPYSQASGLFYNLVLYHEMGHFVGQTSKEVPTALEKGVHKAIAAQLPSAVGDARSVFWLSGWLHNWCHEMFADLFAVRLLGPAFTFSFLDILRTLRCLEPESFCSFGRHHPSPFYRLREQYDLLDTLGWLELIPEKSASLLKRALHAHGEAPLQKVGNRDGQDLDSQVGNVLLRIFQETLPTLRRLAARASGQRGQPPANYAQRADEVRDSLAHALVPSIAFDSDDNPDRFTILLNAAYFFNMNDLELLFRWVEDLKPSRIGDWAWLSHRVELWTLKAIENLLLTGEGELVRHGGSREKGVPEAG